MITPGTFRRRPTCRMYPSPAREQKLPWMKGPHGDPHNGLLEQRITRHRRSGEVTALRQADPAEPGREDDPRAHLDARSLQLTLRRVDRAFQHFFRTCRNPEFGGHPGFPRFKSFGRYSGWTCNHQSGWRIAPKGADRPVGDDRAGRRRSHGLADTWRVHGEAPPPKRPRRRARCGTWSDVSTHDYNSASP